MKKAFSIALLLLLVIVTQAKVIELEYSISDLKVENVGEYSLIHFQDAVNSAPAGEPLLPYLPVNVLLPEGYQADSIVFYGENLVNISGEHCLYPAQYVSSSLNQSYTFVINTETYNSEKEYPSQQYGKISTHIMNGYRIANMAFTPVIYNPKQGKISYYKKIRIKVYSSEDLKSSDSRSLIGSETVRKQISAMVDNPEAISVYEYSGKCEQNYDILVICPSEFEEIFTDYKTNYLLKGYQAKTITTESIYTEIQGDDFQEKIRNCIIEEYENSQISYVLLAGDNEFIPYRGLYAQVIGQDTLNEYDIPADLYYSALDGNWNPDNDSYWGEEGEADFYPEVALGRIPCSTFEELDNVLSKSLKYQNTVIEGEQNHHLFLGENLQTEPETWGGEFLDLHIGNHDNYGYPTVGINESADIKKLYEYNGFWDGQDVVNQVNMGRPFIYHNGYANADYVLKLSSSELNDETFFAADGSSHTNPIIFSQGSECAAFEVDDCIAEAMLNLPNFASAFIGNSRYAWYNPGQADGTTQHIHRAFTSTLYESGGIEIAKALDQAKIKSVPWIEVPGQYDAGAMRYSIYSYNLLGDPAMNIWTENQIIPVLDYPQVVSVNSEAYTVEIHTPDGNDQGYRCAFVKNGQLLGVGVTNQYGIAEIYFNEPLSEVGEAQLFVSGKNLMKTSYAVTIIPAEGAYVCLVSSKVNDELGNNNDIVNNDETIQLNINMQNQGVDEAIDVVCLVQSDDPYVVFTDSTAAFGDMESGESIHILHAVTFDVLDGIPDQHPIILELSSSDITDSIWESEVMLLSEAPDLIITPDLIVDDHTFGNGNGAIEPGETVFLSVKLKNQGHAVARNTIGILSVNNSSVNVSDSQVDVGKLLVNEEEWVEFELQISESMTEGELVLFQFTCQAGAYSANREFGLNIGQNIETFESNDFKCYSWEMEGDNPWVTTSESPFDGIYCAVSGDIDDNQISTMKVTMDLVSNDSIEFYKRTSSEGLYDFLRFYLDGQQLGEWSGETNWSKSVYPVSSGNHTFKWCYEKDYVVSYGQDCAWVDNIIFPTAYFGITSSQIIKNNLHINIFPNPTKNHAYVEVYSDKLNEVFNLCISNLSGQIIEHKQIVISENTSLELDASNWNSGIYFIKIYNRNSAIQQRVIKL